MRFFTEHFFSEEQKAELLGDKYLAQRRSGEAARSRAIEVVQAPEYQQRQEDEFESVSRRVELLALPLVLVVSLAFGLASYLMDGQF